MTLIEKRFRELIEADGTRSNDTERLQLFYIMANVDDIWAKRMEIYDFKEGSLQSNKKYLESATMCTSVKYMIKRSLHLFNSCNEDIPTTNLFDALDVKNARVMNNAEMIRFGLADVCEMFGNYIYI